VEGFLYYFIAYHGTTKKAAPQILEEGLRVSERDGLWLGTGAYFFEAGPGHAVSWAENIVTESDEISVLEAHIEADVVVNLCDKRHWEQVKNVYDIMVSEGEIRGQTGPDGLFDSRKDEQGVFGHNYLDHDVMNRFLQVLEETKAFDGEKIDLVRCPFIGGSQMYHDSWFFKRSCIMLSVRNTKCIKQVREVKRFT
jgi:hypothetical protein